MKRNKFVKGDRKPYRPKCETLGCIGLQVFEDCPYCSECIKTSRIVLPNPIGLHEDRVVEAWGNILNNNPFTPFSGTRLAP